MDNLIDDHGLVSLLRYIPKVRLISTKYTIVLFFCYTYLLQKKLDMFDIHIILFALYVVCKRFKNAVIFKLLILRRKENGLKGKR